MESQPQNPAFTHVNFVIFHGQSMDREKNKTGRR